MKGTPGHDCFSCEVLEFPGIIELVRGFLSGPLSEPLLQKLEPHTDLEQILRDHAQRRDLLVGVDRFLMTSVEVGVVSPSESRVLRGGDLGAPPAREGPSAR